MSAQSIPHNESSTGQPSNAQQSLTTDQSEQQPEKILCPHCQRTATNGIKCRGICVSDSDY